MNRLVVRLVAVLSVAGAIYAYAWAHVAVDFPALHVPRYIQFDEGDLDVVNREQLVTMATYSMKRHEETVELWADMAVNSRSTVLFLGVIIVFQSIIMLFMVRRRSRI